MRSSTREPRVPSLSIVLPCHDEGPNVERVARQAVEVGRRVTDRLEVLVVDDGSTDDTFDRARSLARALPELRVLRHARNLGYGAALRRGFAAAVMDRIFYTDGDGQLDLNQLPELLSLLDDCDVAVGYRERRRDPLLRVWIGRAWTAVVNSVLGLRVRDVNCAFKVFPRSLVEQAELSSDGAAVGAELLLAARHQGHRIGERPVRHRPRSAGRQSGASPRVVARAFLELTRLWTSQAAAPRGAVSPRVLP